MFCNKNLKNILNSLTLKLNIFINLLLPPELGMGLFSEWGCCSWFPSIDQHKLCKNPWSPEIYMWSENVWKVNYEAISPFLAVGAITETAQNNPNIELFITYLDQTFCSAKFRSNVFEFSSKVFEEGNKKKKKKEGRKRKKSFVHTSEKKNNTSRNGTRTQSKNFLLEHQWVICSVFNLKIKMDKSESLLASS